MPRLPSQFREQQMSHSTQSAASLLLATATLCGCVTEKADLAPRPNSAGLSRLALVDSTGRERIVLDASDLGSATISFLDQSGKATMVLRTSNDRVSSIEILGARPDSKILLSSYFDGVKGPIVSCFSAESSVIAGAGDDGTASVTAISNSKGRVAMGVSSSNMIGFGVVGPDYKPRIELGLYPEEGTNSCTAFSLNDSKGKRSVQLMALEGEENSLSIRDQNQVLRHFVGTRGKLTETLFYLGSPDGKGEVRSVVVDGSASIGASDLRHDRGLALRSSSADGNDFVFLEGAIRRLQIRTEANGTPAVHLFDKKGEAVWGSDK